MVNTTHIIKSECGYLFFLFLCFIISFTVSAEEITEYSLKAAFVYNFTDFVSWPSDKPDNTRQKNICVLGKNPFDENLEKIANANKKYNSVEIQYTQDLMKISDCHILFISRSEKYRLLNIVNFLKNQPVLTVSDIQDFAHNKGMIELAVRSRKVSLIVNLEAVNKGGINLSSNLIELANVINGSDIRK